MHTFRLELTNHLAATCEKMLNKWKYFCRQFFALQLIWLWTAESIMSLLTLFLFCDNLSPSNSYHESHFMNRMQSGDEIWNSHVRKKRYAVFPEGSTFTVSNCLLFHFSARSYTFSLQGKYDCRVKSKILIL